MARPVLWMALLLLAAGCGRDMGVSPVPPGSAPWPDAPWLYAIGILRGNDPLALGRADMRKHAPALTGVDITDVPAAFVADPFMIQRSGRWYMFFEVLNAADRQGDIGLAVSDDGKKWTYDRIVLDEPLHLSYPFVFEHDGKVYMVPECYRNKAVRLYVADPFPHQWRVVRDLVPGEYVDPTLLQYGGRWWLFAGNRGNRELRLFHADTLEGDWQEHRLSPVITDSLNETRPAGRFIEAGGQYYRPAQDCSRYYGQGVRLFRIAELTTQRYEDKWVSPEPYLSSNTFTWASWGMHHIDAHRVPGTTNEWLACVDGFGRAQPDVLFDVQFEDAPALQGMRLSRDTCRPGGNLVAWFYWERKLMDPEEADSMAAFVHLKRGRRMVAQADYRFKLGVRVHICGLRLPDDTPAGEYSLHTGLYDPAKPRSRYRVRTKLPVRLNSVKLPLTLRVEATR